MYMFNQHGISHLNCMYQLYGYSFFCILIQNKKSKTNKNKDTLNRGELSFAVL